MTPFSWLLKSMKEKNKQRESTPQLAWLQGSQKSSTALKQLEPVNEAPTVYAS